MLVSTRFYAFMPVKLHGVGVETSACSNREGTCVDNLKNEARPHLTAYMVGKSLRRVLKNEYRVAGLIVKELLMSDYFACFLSTTCTSCQHESQVSEEPSLQVLQR